jgi:YesN/AraC family two-component response regulator
VFAAFIQRSSLQAYKYLIYKNGGKQFHCQIVSAKVLMYPKSKSLIPLCDKYKFCAQKNDVLSKYFSNKTVFRKQQQKHQTNQPTNQPNNKAKQSKAKQCKAKQSKAKQDTHPKKISTVFLKAVDIFSEIVHNYSNILWRMLFESSYNLLLNLLS